MLGGFLAANALILVFVTLLLSFSPAAPPQIHGVLLAPARALEKFELLDNHEQPFTNADLQGRWQVVTYGFTSCPDICPTTLGELAQFTGALESRGRKPPQILFYSVDHRRDTPQQLNSYLPYFRDDFIGLTHRDNPDNPHLPFERSLGIIAELLPSGGPDSSAYQVSHGVHLFLINPAGELQAVFEPSQTRGALPHFQPEDLLEDYLKVRDYLATSDSL